MRPDFAEWDMRDAREFEFEAEDEADLPVLFPLFGVAAAVVCLNTAKNSPPPVPREMRPCRIYGTNQPTTGGRAGHHFLLNGI